MHWNIFGDILVKMDGWIPLLEEWNRYIDYIKTLPYFIWLIFWNLLDWMKMGSHRLQKALVVLIHPGSHENKYLYPKLLSGLWQQAVYYYNSGNCSDWNVAFLPYRGTRELRKSKFQKPGPSLWLLFSDALWRVSCFLRCLFKGANSFQIFCSDLGRRNCSVQGPCFLSLYSCLLL